MSDARKVIGVCGSRLFEQNALKFVEDLMEAGRQRGYFPVAFCAYSDECDEEEAYGEKQLFELCRCTELCCLVILTETLKHEDLIQQLVEIGRQGNIPVFTLDRGVEGCYNLVMDYCSGFEQIVRHVVEDHEVDHINMVAGFRNNAFSEERIAIYRKVLEENNIPFEEERVGYGDFWERPTRVAIRNFLDSDLPKPGAIICANDSMAITACSELKKAGYKVPQDIIVTGFDGIQNGKYHTPMIATCEPDYRTSLEFIFQEIEKAEETGRIEPCDFMVDFAMMPNQSCGCAPKRFYDRNGVISTLFDEVSDCAWHNIAMNQMVTAVLDKRNIMDIAQILPDIVTMWSDHSHFACVKSELFQNGDIPAHWGQMVTLLQGNHQEFQPAGRQFPAQMFIPGFKEVIQEGSGVDVVIVRLLNSGRNVYGYIVEGFHQLDVRKLQRCNEFAMFLSHSINTILHNNKLNELNRNLTEAYNEISSMYVRDAMTGIYNRRGFYQNLDGMLRQQSAKGKYLYIISVDMDGLKHINDTYGHAEGDFAIVSTAKAVFLTCGEAAICARFGGDEFVCAFLLPEPDAVGELEWSLRLNQNLRGIPGVMEKPYPVCASVGMACCKVEEGLNAENLIMFADHRMYKDKMARKQQRKA